MRKRRVGYSDLDFTVVGLGTWAIGGPWEWGWSVQDDAESIATIRSALELGINWIDTAPCYGLGHSEEIVGKAIAGHRDDVFIATKCGLVWEDRSQGTTFGRLKGWSVRQEVEDSLKRLGTDVIDLYQIHWPDPDEDIEEAWTEVAKLVEEGKVRYGGVSNFSVPQLKRAQSIHPVASHQPPYSMLHRDIEDELLPYCSAHDIGVICYGPLQAGLLTGKFTHQTVGQLPADDWRRKSADYREPRLSEHLARVSELTTIANGLGVSVAQLAVAWAIRDESVTSAIVGARRPDQIKETVAGGSIRLQDDILAEIEDVLTD